MKVLYIYPFGPFHPISSGSDVIANNHLEYFKQKGATVDCIVYRILEKEKHMESFRQQFSFCRSITELRIPPIRFKFSELLYGSECATRMEPLQSLLQNQYDFLFSNYVFTAPIALKATRAKNKVLETVDHLWEAFSFSQSPKNKSTMNDLFFKNMEFDLYKAFNKILFINKEEFLTSPRESNTTYAFIPPAWPGTNTCQTKNSEEPIDILFIGSNHRPNIEGLDFFYKNAFLPHLRPRGATLTVAGKVCDFWHMEDPRVTKLGFYQGSITQLYSSAKTVIIPILEGTGLSIKTLEAMAFGKAIITTPKGARGMALHGNPFVITDLQQDPEGFARAVSDLLESPQKRTTLGQAAFEQFQKEHSFEVYSKRMDQFLGLAAS